METYLYKGVIELLDGTRLDFEWPDTHGPYGILERDWVFQQQIVMMVKDNQRVVIPWHQVKKATLIVK